MVSVYGKWSFRVAGRTDDCRRLYCPSGYEFLNIISGMVEEFYERGGGFLFRKIRLSNFEG